MRASPHARRDAPAPSRTERARTLLCALACCLLLTACPPGGGDLMPLAGADGAELATDKVSDDTLRLTRAGVTVAARGRWSVADAATSVILDISNANASAVRVDFGRAELFNQQSGARTGLRSVSDETGGGPHFLQERVVRIEGGQARRFALEFRLDADDGRAGAARDLRGQTTTLRLPVEVEAESPVRVDFALDFKYAEYRQ